ncbi:MAG TPA: ABC-2 family transporter protein [Chloroflexota bacterium]|nr:ABC-2 family transporter protein [Chloroflexota bacterium]
MAVIFETGGIYGRLIGAHLRSQMQHKVSFVLRTLGTFAANFFDFAGIAVLFGRIPQLSGWSLPEVALLYGISSLCFATAELFGGALDNFDTVIVQGTFDRVLLRPLDALFQVLTEEFALRRLGRMAQGGLVLGIALAQLPVSWTAGKVLFLAISLVSGTALFLGIFVLGAAYCFWIVQGKEATHVVTYGGDFMSNYPMDIYSHWLKRFATFVLPIGFVSYYPSLYLLERSDPFGLPDWFRLMGPVAAAAVCLAAWCAWRGGVSQYQSTGS